jgi:hypothetical protein
MDNRRISVLVAGFPIESGMTIRLKSEDVLNSIFFASSPVKGESPFCQLRGDRGKKSGREMRDRGRVKPTKPLVSGKKQLVKN